MEMPKKKCLLTNGNYIERCIQMAFENTLDTNESD